MKPTLPSLPEIVQTVEDYRCLKSRNLGKLMHIGWREYSAYVENRLQELGHTQFRISMMAIMGNLEPEGNTIVELADKIRYTKQAMGKLVRDLELAGYVQTETHPQDKRAQLVRFTHKGLQLMRDASANIGRIRKEFTKALDDTEIDQLLDLLERLVQSNVHLLQTGNALIDGKR